MGQRGGALVAVRVQVEVHRQPGLQAQQAAEQALRVVRQRAGRLVVGGGERARQVELAAVGQIVSKILSRRSRVVLVCKYFEYASCAPWIKAS